MKNLKNLTDTHQKFADYATPGPWQSEQNNHTGKMEVIGQEGLNRKKIFEMDKFTDEDLDFIVHSRELLPRYVKALKFLTDCYKNSAGEESAVAKETLTHVEEILQGTT